MKTKWILEKKTIEGKKLRCIIFNDKISVSQMIQGKPKDNIEEKQDSMQKKVTSFNNKLSGQNISQNDHHKYNKKQTRTNKTKTLIIKICQVLITI